MLAFFRCHRHNKLFVPQPVAQIGEVSQGLASVTDDSALLLSVPWGHHLLLMEKIKDEETRRWYLQAIVHNGWSRNVLLMQIDSHAHLRQGQATTNFAQRLPDPQSDLAQQSLKDPYLFDFLTLEEPFHERELETGLLRHLEKFLLELGQGFAFLGRQYHLILEERDFLSRFAVLSCAATLLCSDRSQARRIQAGVCRKNEFLLQSGGRPITPCRRCTDHRSYFMPATQPDSG